MNNFEKHREPGKILFGDYQLFDTKCEFEKNASKFEKDFSYIPGNNKLGTHISYMFNYKLDKTLTRGAQAWNHDLSSEEVSYLALDSLSCLDLFLSWVRLGYWTMNDDINSIMKDLPIITGYDSFSLNRGYEVVAGTKMTCFPRTRVDASLKPLFDKRKMIHAESLRSRRKSRSRSKNRKWEDDYEDHLIGRFMSYKMLENYEFWTVPMFF